ncbi:MAG TPA: hypothetical protein VFG04_30875 [Planctomycetaceae bacterium]|jgi:hypothetical protein|nr:hypothetical protein [Planctomycetaceae bacterium]
MSESQKKPNGERSGWRSAIWFAVLLLAIYVLGIGPAARFEFTYKASHRVRFHDVYAPLDELARFKAPGKVIAFYIKLWVPSNCYVFPGDSGFVLVEDASAR